MLVQNYQRTRDAGRRRFLKGMLGRVCVEAAS